MWLSFNTYRVRPLVGLVPLSIGRSPVVRRYSLIASNNRNWWINQRVFVHLQRHSIPPDRVLQQTRSIYLPRSSPEFEWPTICGERNSSVFRESSGRSLERGPRDSMNIRKARSPTALPRSGFSNALWIYRSIRESWTEPFRTVQESMKHRFVTRTHRVESWSTEGNHPMNERQDQKFEESAWLTVRRINETSNPDWP